MAENAVPQVYRCKRNISIDWSCFQFTPSDVESGMYVGLYQTRRLFSPFPPVNFHKSAKASCVLERKGAGGLWEQWKGIHKSVREHLAKPDIS